MAGTRVSTLTHDRLLQVLNYDPETGDFVWKQQLSTSKGKIGTKAGCVGPGGYWQIGIDEVRFLGHRLAWFYVFGIWPKRLDHKDGTRTNNRIANLREATVSQNAANKHCQKNISGFKGVQARPNNRWRALIEVNGKCLTLGTFGTPQEASAAYFAAAQKFHGEFARMA
jgi:hypothetical protein